MTNFNDLTKTQLWALRKEIVVNCICFSDYENSFGYNRECLSSFFDGYYDYLWELAYENYKNPTHTDAMSYDNEDTLWEWFNFSDDLSWIDIV